MLNALAQVQTFDAALGDHWALVLVLADPVEMLHIIGATQELHKIFIMGDDEQLEVTLLRATLDDSAIKKVHRC